MRILNIDELKDMISNGDRSIIGCYISQEDMSEFYRYDKNELESGDFVECEGGRELVVDNTGKILFFEGYYFEIK